MGLDREEEVAVLAEVEVDDRGVVGPMEEFYSFLPKQHLPALAPAREHEPLSFEVVVDSAEMCDV